MSKVGKYRQYVIDNLIKDTLIDDSQVFVPFKKGTVAPYDFVLFLNDAPRMGLLKHKFVDYVKSKYGARDEDISEIFFGYADTLNDKYYR